MFLSRRLLSKNVIKIKSFEDSRRADIEIRTTSLRRLMCFNVHVRLRVFLIFKIIEKFFNDFLHQSYNREQKHSIIEY